MVAIHNQDFDPATSSVFSAPEQRVVRVSGGWFGDVYVPVGIPLQEIEVPDFVDETNYAAAQKILAELEDLEANAEDLDDEGMQLLGYMIEDLQTAISDYEDGEDVGK